MMCSSRNRKAFENRAIGFEENFGAVGFGLLALLLRLEFTSFEVCAEKLTVAITGNRKTGREGVNCLRADAVQSDAELEDVVIVFRACIDPRNAVDHLAERDAASVVSDADEIAVDCNIDLAAIPHDELVDGIVDDLFQKDIDAVIMVGAIPQAADVHAGTRPDVFQGGERLDLTFVVIVLPWRTWREERVGVSACRRVWERIRLCWRVTIRMRCISNCNYAHE